MNRQIPRDALLSIGLNSLECSAFYARKQKDILSLGEPRVVFGRHSVTSEGRSGQLNIAQAVEFCYPVKYKSREPGWIMVGVDIPVELLRDNDKAIYGESEGNMTQ